MARLIACEPFAEIVWALQALDRQLPKLEEGSSAAAFGIENVLAEVEDLLSYCNDILCTGDSHTLWHCSNDVYWLADHRASKPSQLSWSF